MNLLSFCYVDGQQPLDHTPIRRVYRGIGRPSFWIFCICACLGTLLATFFLGFNLKFRMQRYIMYIVKGHLGNPVGNKIWEIPLEIRFNF